MVRVSEGETGTETGCSALASSSGTGSIGVSSSADLTIVGLRELVFLTEHKRLKDPETFRNERVGEGMGMEREWE